MTDISLRELLTDLSRDPTARAAFQSDPTTYLESHGHELPDELVGETIGHVAAVLPAETAEHLAPFTTADSPIPSLDDSDGAEIGPLDGLEMLASAPVGDAEPPADPDATPVEAALEQDQDFGSGAGAEEAVVEEDAPEADFDDELEDDLGLSADPTSGLDEFDPAGLGAPAPDLELELEDDLTLPEPTIDDDDPAELDGLE